MDDYKSEIRRLEANQKEVCRKISGSAEQLRTKPENILLSILLLLILLISGCKSEPANSQPHLGMSEKELFELCGSSDEIIFEENVDGGKVVHIYKSKENGHGSGCRGKFTFTKDELSSIREN